MNARREKGLYWDRAWKLCEGCAKVSAGCDNCWSEQETVMRCGHPNTKIRERARAAVHLAQIPRDKTMFDGRIVLRHDNLDMPLRVKTPTVFAVWNDLYYEDVPDDFRDRAYAVMALCPQHTFLVLTKRAERMARYFAGLTVQRVCENYNGDMDETADIATNFRKYWPLPNIWHGVTAEHQSAADERIPHLLRVPGKRFLSLEPMLSGINLHAAAGHLIDIHAVLLGGESGKGARPMHPDWARSVRDQCAEAGVPLFFKQSSGVRPEKLPLLDGARHAELPWDEA